MVSYVEGGLATEVFEPSFGLLQHNALDALYTASVVDESIDMC